jgi:hypothetical protein
MDSRENKKQHYFSEWLDKLQQESWQLELLISGLALFGIWESRELVYNLQTYFEVNSVSSMNFYQDAFLFILRTGWVIFFINLLIHIIIRGLWIGAIGLRYVSGDIDFDELDYSPEFQNYYKKKIGSFDMYVERLEKLSSVLFSYTFLLFFLVLSLIAFVLFFSLISTLLDHILGEPASGVHLSVVILGVVYFGLGFLVFLDFVSLGMFKKITDKTVSKVYLAIYRFYSTVSLSFIYRPLLLNFIDNAYTKRLFFLAIPYALAIVLTSGQLYSERYGFIPSFDFDEPFNNEISRSSVNWIFYDDLRLAHVTKNGTIERNIKKKKISYASLNAYAQAGNVADLFLEYRMDDDQLLNMRNPSLTAFKKTGLRHSLFMINNVKDEVIETLRIEENRKINYFRFVLRGETEKIDSSYQAQFGYLTDSLKQYTVDDYDSLVDNIQNEYRSARSRHMEDRLLAIKQELLNLYRVEIDGKMLTEDLDCSFFTHPNLRERGLLCHIFIDSLARGKHIIDIRKIEFKNGCTDDCPVHRISIPFLKVQ